MISIYHSPAYLNTDFTEADGKRLEIDDRGIGGSRVVGPLAGTTGSV